MSFKHPLKDIDYTHKLNKEERLWLKRFAVGTQNCTRKWLTQLDEVAGEHVYRRSIAEREARRRDIFTQGQRFENENFSLGLFENLPSTFEGEMTMTTFEDAIIDKVDAERMGKPYKATSYGNNEQVPIGADVVICIEGHALQNKLGKVTAIRRGQYLVRAQTGKGDVEIYVSAHEVARVNSMKQVG